MKVTASLLLLGLASTVVAFPAKKLATPKAKVGAVASPLPADFKNSPSVPSDLRGTPQGGPPGPMEHAPGPAAVTPPAAPTGSVAPVGPAIRTDRMMNPDPAENTFAPDPTAIGQMEPPPQGTPGSEKPAGSSSPLPSPLGKPGDKPSGSGSASPPPPTPKPVETPKAKSGPLPVPKVNGKGKLVIPHS